VRVAPRDILCQPGANTAIVPIRNRHDDHGLRSDEQVGNEFQQLVRFGLRSADDPLIRGSVVLADAFLRTDTPNGPVWHRYRQDGYGEHEDGHAYDGTGIGRGWPLLTGERGHYELCAGNDPLPYLAAMAAMASPGGMIPEQVWDTDPIPARRLVLGEASGSAMPLVWAHAEFVKLLVSRQIEHPYDRPRAAWQRYRGKRPKAEYAFWWPHAPIASLTAGTKLAIALSEPATVRWGRDDWQAVADVETTDSELGFHVAVLATADLPPDTGIEFTWRPSRNNSWVGRNFSLTIFPAKSP
jgi:glucoamylase